MTLFLTTLWLLVPAGIANLMPVLVTRVPFLNAPIDGGRSWRGHRITGDHKTYRGFFFGMLGGAGASYLEYLLYPWVANAVAFDYGAVSPIALGVALGFGALLGDTIKSFFKRQMGIEAGKSWPPFDQLDWVAGALIALAFFIPVTPLMAIYAFMIGIPLHALTRWLSGIILSAIAHRSAPVA